MNSRSPSPTAARARQRGFTLMELLLAMIIGAVLVAGLSEVTGQIVETRRQVTDRNDLNRQARFALDRMARAAANSPRLLLPYNDRDSTTAITENVHSVLAVTLDHLTDLDANGIPDADNDGDGRFDEDPPGDWTNDNAAGIYLIDDDVDGNVDEVGNAESDDESTTINDDPVDGTDDDDDQNLDEDPPADINNDRCPGICGVDDDGDGIVDEGNADDDDEDGSTDDDWLDPVVFYLSGSQLIERHPVPWDEDASSGIDGRDFVESVIVDNVSRFRVERLPAAANAPVLVDIQLDITSPASGQTIALQTRVRVGGAL